MQNQKIPLNKGVFIAIEGVDGSGKTTVITAVAQRLREEGYLVDIISVVNGVGAIRDIRQILLHADYSDGLDDNTRHLLYTTARYLNTPNILDKLSKGYIVLADRWMLSGYAYQNKADPKLVFRTSEFLEGIAAPDDYIVLDIDYQTSQKRLLARGAGKDALERIDEIEFLRRRQRLLGFKYKKGVKTIDVSSADQPAVIDATHPKDVVVNSVYNHIKNFI